MLLNYEKSALFAKYLVRLIVFSATDFHQQRHINTRAVFPSTDGYVLLPHLSRLYASNIILDVPPPIIRAWLLDAAAGIDGNHGALDDIDSRSLHGSVLIAARSAPRRAALLDLYPAGKGGAPQSST